MTSPNNPLDRPVAQPAIPTQPGPTEPPAAPPASRRRLWIIAAVVVLLAVAGSVAAFAWPTDNKAAVSHCQDEIRSKMKSPSTTKFLGATVDHEGGSIIYRVTGELDAQNGFGATVRGSYQCGMTHDKDGSWVATTAEFDQR